MGYHFGLAYNKVFKPEYLPGRVRFNQFFFFLGLGSLWVANRRYVSLSMSEVLKGWQFTDTRVKTLGERKYYSMDRAYVNPIQASIDRSLVRSQVSQQDFTL